MRLRKNMKRKLFASSLQARSALAARVEYGGNPAHKRNPGDYGLTPPASPRPNKTLCDAAEIFQKKMALALLKQGIEKGLTSEWAGNGFPKHIWAVTADGMALEAKLDDPVRGRYHGYPLLRDDPFRHVVLEAWHD